MAQDWFALHAPKAKPTSEPARDWFAQNAARKPASPDDFTDRPSTPDGSAAGRFARGAWDMLNPVTIAEGLYGAVRHPVDTGKALVGAQLEQFGKAADAFKEGRYSEAAGYAGAGVLPVIGPVAANIGEQIGGGDVAGGLGAATGVIAPMAAARPVAGAVARKASKLKARAAAAVTPAPEVADAARWALEQGVPVDVATASGNRVVSGAKNLADRSLGGTVVGERAARMRAESMAKLGRNLANKAAPGAQTPETAGRSVLGAVDDVIKREAGVADDAYGRVRAAERAAMPDDVPVSRPVSPKIPVEEGFIGHWLADDLQEMGYQAGGVTKRMAREAYENWRPGDAESARHGIGQQAARVAGTPTLQMFHDAGITGSRMEIADRIRRVLNGSSNDAKVKNLLGAMREAWDGQRFDWQLVSDERMAATGLKRSQMKSPVTMPAQELPGFERMFFGDAAGVVASGTEPMQFAVPMQAAKENLRPILDRLLRKKELTGQLMGDEARAATALDALVSGPDHAPLSVVDAALGDLKTASRAAIPELRTSGQGVAAQAVKELEALVQARAKDAGVWDDLRAGRDATIAKWSAAETLDALRAEPVQTFRALTQNADAAVEKLQAVKKIAPGEMPKIGRAYLENMLDLATSEGGFGREARLWADWQKLGDSTKALIFPDAELRSALDKFFLVGKKMAENPNPSGTSYVAGIGAQGGLLVTNPASGAATVLAGAAVSKMLNSPTLARLLVEGMQTPKSAPAARSLAARIRVAAQNAAKQAAPAAPAFGAAVQPQGRR